jgi:hypothetical protein
MEPSEPLHHWSPRSRLIPLEPLARGALGASTQVSKNWMLLNNHFHTLLVHRSAAAGKLGSAEHAGAYQNLDGIVPFWHSRAIMQANLCTRLTCNLGLPPSSARLAATAAAPAPAPAAAAAAAAVVVTAAVAVTETPAAAAIAAATATAAAAASGSDSGNDSGSGSDNVSDIASDSDSGSGTDRQWQRQRQRQRQTEAVTAAVHTATATEFRCVVMFPGRHAQDTEHDSQDLLLWRSGEPAGHGAH